MVHEQRKLTEDYEISDILGRGGFSVVRLGNKMNSTIRGKDQVAIKTLKRVVGPSSSSSSSSSSGGPTWKQVSISDALLTNEIMVMKRIVEEVSQHENVIDLYDVYEDSEGVHLILELCSGGELFDRIVSQKQYSELEAAGVVRQLAKGLFALHKANIVHRDLKPENCLFLDCSEKSTLKITDFGLSSVEDFTDPVVGFFGSIDYVSPETLSRSYKVTSASDLWSLGVILYILLSGYPPFMAQSNKQKQQMIINGEYSFHEKTWKKISSAAKQVISGLLTVDPQKRMTATELLQHPWVKGELAKQDQIDPEVVSRLQSFNARRKFRAAAIASMYTSTIFMRTKKLKSLLGSHDLKPDEIEKFRTHFHTICDGDNATLDEFKQVLKAMNMMSLIPMSRRIFDLFDNNRDGTVDMREILCGFTTLRKSQGDDALRLCFQLYDADRSGWISKEEVASMLRALPDECLPADITEPGKLDEVFDKMDANNDGKVSFEEFKAAMTRDSSLKDVLLSSLRPM